MLCKMFFGVDTFDIRIQKIVHIIRRKFGRQSDLHRVTQKIHSVVIVHKAWVSFKDVRLFWFLDVLLYTLRSFFSECLKKLEEHL
ncbi:hypothetical protein D3C87_1483000 [compost metagenome]